MTKLIIQSDERKTVLPLVKGAIDEQRHNLGYGISHLEEELKEFERKYKMKTNKFYTKFVNGKLGDSLDYLEWAGSYELLQKLSRDLQRIREIEICA